MSELFLDSIQDPISVINSSPPKIVLDGLGESDRKHGHIFTYATAERQREKAREADVSVDSCSWSSLCYVQAFGVVTA